MAEEASGVTYWQEFKIGENGEVIFYGEPESTWVEKYTVWDMLKIIFDNVDSIEDIGDLLNPEPLDEPPF